MDLIMPKKQVATADSDSEVDAFRKLLNKSKKGSEALMLQKKSRTINKMGMWEELEMVYRDMEQREKDYQVAVEIGKMLLDKNKELSDINAQLRIQLEDFQQSNEAEIIKVTDENEKLQNQKDELKKELKHLKLQMNMMATGTTDTEMKAMLMSEEFAKMEEKLEKYKKEINQYKTKNKSLSDELERTKADLDSSKQELEEEKKKVKTTKVQIRQQLEQQQPVQELSQEEIAEREKLEEELTALAMSKAKLEQIMDDLSSENSKLKEAITDKEDQRTGLERMIDSLSKANHMLQKQQEEERQLLEDKVNTISNLQQQIEEQHLRREELIVPSLQAELWQTGVALPDPGLSRPPTLQSVPSFGSMSSSSLSSTQPARSQEEEEDLEHERKKREWQDRMTQLQSTDNELKQKEEKMLNQEIDKDDKDWLLSELKKFRKTKAEEHSFLAVVYELRERLYDAEIKNLSRTMRNVGHFQDLVLYSHAIIDTVIKDINRKVIAKEPENPSLRIIADLILENCKLRKIANDYAEAINQGTIEKLEKFKKYWPTTNKTEMKKEDSKKSIWQHLPLFDFFTGWSTPPPQHAPQSTRNKGPS